MRQQKARIKAEKEHKADQSKLTEVEKARTQAEENLDTECKAKQQQQEQTNC